MIHRYKRDAAEELFDAIAHYEAERPGLGGEFLDEIDAGLATIKEAPTRWPAIEQEVRHYRLHRFPYHIIYQIKYEAISIVAIAHLHRKPGYWRDRLS